MPCHTRGNIGAMPLTNYGEARAYGKMIQYVTENKLMPPWKADAEFSPLKHQNSLTQIEIATIKAWVENGMPEGTATETTPPPITSSTGIANPDVVLAMEKSFAIANDYIERSQVFVIPIGLTNDAFIEAIEFVPGNAKIVKSCTISIDTGQTATRYDDNDLNYGYSTSAGVGFIPYQYNWYQWAPGRQADFYPSPYVKKLSAGSKLLFQITYRASTTVQKDSSYVKLRFAKSPPPFKLIQSEVLLDTTRITNGPFRIDVGDKKKFYTAYQVERPIEIHSVMPVGQTALSSWEIYAMDSLTGQRINLLKIPYWDAHWKAKYELATPVRLSAGSKIFGVAYYDNSDDNPNLIILPPKKIRYGEGQRDELFAVQFDVVYMEATKKQSGK